jgi:hypothetical protein
MTFYAYLLGMFLSVPSCIRYLRPFAFKMIWEVAWIIPAEVHENTRFRRPDNNRWKLFLGLYARDNDPKRESA